MVYGNFGKRDFHTPERRIASISIRGSVNGSNIFGKSRHFFKEYKEEDDDRTVSNVGK